MADVLNEGIRLFQKANLSKGKVHSLESTRGPSASEPASADAERKIAAANLARQRWVKVAPEARTEIARTAARARWAKRAEPSLAAPDGSDGPGGGSDDV